LGTWELLLENPEWSVLSDFKTTQKNQRLGVVCVGVAGVYAAVLFRLLVIISQICYNIFSFFSNKAEYNAGKAVGFQRILLAGT